MTAPMLNSESPDRKKQINNITVHTRLGLPIIVGAAPIHELRRLPKSFRGATDGHHMNSHPFLVDDFVRAVVGGQLPPNNAWDAARCMIPGLVAHESAMQNGKLMEVNDFGDAPSDWTKLTYEHKDYYEADTSYDVNYAKQSVRYSEVKN